MKIKMNRVWNAADVRSMCIREKFYTCGNCEDYSQMLEYVDTHRNISEDFDIYAVARDILIHTDKELEQTVENIMYILANDVIKYFYEVEYSEAEIIIARAEAE